MKILFKTMITVSALVSITCASSLSPREKSWSVLSWNVQNIFDGVDDGTEYSEFDPGKGEWTHRLYHRRLERAGKVILASPSGGPDLLILQEVENLRVMEDLAKGPLRGRNYKWILTAPGPGAVRVGVLSRYQIESVEAVEVGWWGSRFLRPLLGMKVLTPAGTVHVMAVHWKSPRDGRELTEPARRAEAEIAASRFAALLKADSSVEALLIGDLNTPADGTVHPAALAPWSSDFSAPLPALFVMSRSFPSPSEIPEFPPLLYDPDPDPALGPEGTYVFRGAWDRPDRALLTRGLLEEPRWVLTSCRVPASGIMGNNSGGPQRWITRHEEGYSDHFPLLLIFSRGGSSSPP